MNRWQVVAAVAVVGLLAWQQWQIQDLTKRVANPLIEPRILALLERAATRDAASPAASLTRGVAPPGAQPVPVTIRLAPSYTFPPFPGSPSFVVPPKVVAESPPIYCATKQACDAIYARAPQAVTVEARILPGTLVEVCLEPLVHGACREEKRFSGPLSRPVTFSAQFVLGERGVFQGLNVVGGPVEITKVTTETSVEPVPDRGLPYHLAAVVRAGSTTFAGLRYTNRVGPGFYEIEAGYGFPGLAGSVAFVLPLR